MRHDLLKRIEATKKPFKLYTDIIEDGALTQFAECMEQPSVVQGALMPDTHSGYVAPIGSVLKTKETIFPSFIGYDIGCGMSSITLNVKADSLSILQLEHIKNEILKTIPIGFTRQNKKQNLTKQLKSMPMSDFVKDILLNQGRVQLGTLGGGNHFLEVGKTINEGLLAIVIHSGSRGVGHKIATHYMKEAAIINTDKNRYAVEFDVKNVAWGFKAMTSSNIQENYNKAKKEFVYRRVRARVDNIEGAYPLDTSTPLGQAYINDMNMALEFALENRKLMINNSIKAIVNIIGYIPEQTRFINRNHNHAELVDSYWIHRKGATQAAKGMLGVIPGNMVDGSFIVEGKGNQESMNSSSHGAGRVLSRRKAKEQLSLTEFKQCTKHLVANHSDNNLDEAPKAYKNIFDVMVKQEDLVKVLDKIVPVINIKGQ